jgi:hypothetical protein
LYIQYYAVIDFCSFCSFCSTILYVLYVQYGVLYCTVLIFAEVCAGGLSRPGLGAVAPDSTLLPCIVFLCDSGSSFFLQVLLHTVLGRDTGFRSPPLHSTPLHCTNSGTTPTHTTLPNLPRLYLTSSYWNGGEVVCFALFAVLPIPLSTAKKFMQCVRASHLNAIFRIFRCHFLRLHLHKHHPYLNNNT